MAAMRRFFVRQAQPAPPPTPAPAGEPLALAEAYAYTREHLPEADNLGATGDDRDFYTHLDRLADGVAKAFPESFCRSGCSGCCHYPVGLFTTSMTEWDVMRRHMEDVWTDAEREDFVARFQAVYGGWWRVVLSWLQNNFAAILLSAPFVMRKKLACPFLKDHRCTIYAARPYQCRTFGYFAAREWPAKLPKVYACSAQGDNMLNLLAREGPQMQLPVMNPIVKRIRKLCAGPKQALPMWAAGWVAHYERERAKR